MTRTANPGLFRIALAVCLLPALAPAAPRTHTDPAHGINFYSIEREIALGRQLAAELERQIKLVDDPILVEYVNRLARNVARPSDVSIPVTVKIIESGDLNAFTLPGGHIYIHSAMLKLTESEAELAFVLAHELGHVAARHATREASRDELLSIGSIPLAVFGGWTGLGVRQLVSAGGRLGILKGAREFEAQADRLGVEFLDRAGYDPAASVDVFERIEATERKRPNVVARLYEDHPITASRIEQTQKRLGALERGRTEWIINTSEYETMRLRVVAIEERRQLLEAAQEKAGPRLIKLPESE